MVLGKCDQNYNNIEINNAIKMNSNKYDEMSSTLNDYFHWHYKNLKNNNKFKDEINKFVHG